METPDPDDTAEQTAQTLLARAYSRWRRPLLRMIGKYLRNPADAEDAAQEVFARYAAAGKSLPADEQEPYLRTSARHLSYDAWQKSPARHGIELVSLSDQTDDVARMPADDAYDPVHGAEQRQRLSRLRAAIAELPPRQREAFVLHSIDGLSQTDVAQRMGISRRMVYNHVHLALAYCQLRVRYASAADMEMMQAQLLGPDDSTPDAGRADGPDSIDDRSCR